MLFFRTLFLGLIALIAFGCAPGSDVSGIYVTEVSQDSGREVIVGDLELSPDGQYHSSLGQLRLSGRWSAARDKVFLQGGDEISRFLPSQYRVDGDQLIAQFEGVDAKHWRFVKKRSQTVADRLH